MATLYRKYRPQNFKEVVNQNHVKITLEHEIAAGQAAHAYLFCGPRAVGKTTIARVLAKAVNCEKRKEGEYEPCNKCAMCEEITGGRSLDIMEIDAASHTGVDNVRENIIAAARVAPSRAKYKIFIIDEAHMLSISAFNALLKVMEEPPAFVIFVLCTTEVHKVPSTIISRCERFDFRRINTQEIVKKLRFIADQEKIKIDKEILETIARQADGYMRDAESILGQVVAIGGKKITLAEADLVIPRSDLGAAINLIEYLSRKDAAGGIALINKLIDEGISLKQFLTDLIELLRKIMISKINPALSAKLGLELGENIEIKINQVSQNLSLNQIISFIEKFIIAKNELKGSFIRQLPAEMAIAELCVAPAVQLRPASVQNPAIKQADAIADKPRPANPAHRTAQTVKNTDDINKEAILAKWNEVLEKIKKHNHSLSFVLRVCQPRDINGRQLCLAFKYKFHKDRINDHAIKPIVEQVLREVYGLPIIIEAIIDESIEADNGSTINGNETVLVNRQTETSLPKQESGEIKNNASDDNMTDNLLKTLGGKIVG